MIHHSYFFPSAASDCRTESLASNNLRIATVFSQSSGNVVFTGLSERGRFVRDLIIRDFALAEEDISNQSTRMERTLTKNDTLEPDTYFCRYPQIVQL